MMRYEEPQPMGREEAEAAFAKGGPEEVCQALISITFHERDWRWVEEKCIVLSRDPEPSIRGLAATCFGHLARIHRKLDTDKVFPILERMLKDPKVSGRAEDALDDIKTFLGKAPIGRPAAG